MLVLLYNVKFFFFLILFFVYYFMVRYTVDFVIAVVWGGGGGGFKFFWFFLYREYWLDGFRGLVRYILVELEVRYFKLEVRSIYYIKIKSMIYKKISFFLNY